MAQFKPIMVTNKNDLFDYNKIPLIAGQYLVAYLVGEVYLDQEVTNEKGDKYVQRVKTTQNIYTQKMEPEAAQFGDIWLEVE